MRLRRRYIYPVSGGGGYSGNFTPPFSEVQAYMNGVIASNSGLTPTVSTIGAIGGTNQYYGHVLGTNGKIYGVPFSASTSIELDPLTELYSTFGSAPGNTYAGGCLAKDGKLYYAPTDSTRVGQVDTSIPSLTSYGSTISGWGKFIGGVLAPNGYIYFLGDSYAYNVKFNPATGTYINLAAKSRSAGGCLAANGKIYCAPYTTGVVQVIDTADDSMYTIGSVNTNIYTSPTIAANGKIYCVGYNTGNVIEIDPTTDTVTSYGSGVGKYFGSCLAPNGKIYASPFGAGNILEFDPVTKAINTYGSGLGTYVSLHLAANGIMYALPFGVNPILKIDLSANPFDLDTCLTSYLNKF